MGRVSGPTDIRPFLTSQEFWLVDNFNGWTAATAGTGGTTRGPRQGQARSGTTTAGTGLIRTGNTIGWSLGKDYRVLDWSQQIVVTFFATMIATTTNGISRMTLGRATADGVGDFDDKGVGFRWDATAVTGLTHNGTDLVELDLSTTVTEDTLDRYTIESDGAGNIEWFYNGASVGTSSGGPTGDSTSVHNIVQAESDNGADNADQRIQLHSLKIFVEQ